MNDFFLEITEHPFILLAFFIAVFCAWLTRTLNQKVLDQEQSISLDDQEAGVAPHPYQWAVEGPPVGRWQTASGSFEVAMQSHFVFHPNGTGELVQGNAFGLEQPILFEWKHISSGELRVFTKYADIPLTEQELEKNNEENWSTVSYTADTITNDAGAFPVLRDKTPSFPDTFPVSFWDTHFAITLVSREDLGLEA